MTVSSSESPCAHPPVARILPLTEKFSVSHDSPIRMGAAHVLHISVVIREAHHQAGPLANALGERREALIQRRVCHAVLSASPPRRPPCRLPPGSPRLRQSRARSSGQSDK